MGKPVTVNLPPGSTAIRAFSWTWLFRDECIRVSVRTDADLRGYTLPFDSVTRFVDDAGRVAVTITVPEGDSYYGPKGMVNVETPPEGFIWRKE